MITFVYTEFTVFCLVILLIILNKTISNRLFSISSPFFIVLLSTCLAYILLDAFWSLAALRIIKVSVRGLTVITQVWHIMASIAILAWVWFQIFSLGKKIYSHKSLKFVPSVLLVAEIFVIVFFSKDGGIFRITSDYEYVNGPYRNLLFLIQQLNYYFLLLLVLIGIIRCKDKALRRKYIDNSLLFCIMPLILSWAQIEMSDAPFYSMTFALSCFMVYAYIITFENAEIRVKYQDEKNKAEFQESLKREYSVLSSLAGTYDFVGIVDVSDNKISIVRCAGAFSSFGLKPQDVIEGKQLDKILISIVDPLDMPKFMEVTDRNEAYNKLLNGNRITMDFISKKEDEVNHFRLYLALDKDNVNNVLVAIRSVQGEYDLRKEIEQQQAQINTLQMQNEMAYLMANLDGLTGLMTKLAFIQKVECEIAENTAKDSALIFFDMDHFKNINDKLGHEKGDIALREMAKKLKKMFRSDELIARMGGDEFCIYLPLISKKIVEERIKQMNKELLFTFTDDEGKITVNTSVSIGCVYCEKSELSYIEMYKMADKAMYEVKQRGRNGHEIKIV